MTDLSRGFKRLSADEAANALYIDFEGEKDKAPILLGTLRRPGRGSMPFVHQEVLDPTFERLGLAVLSLRSAVEKVVVRAEARNSRIVSWSEHDLRVVRTLGTDDPELVARFEVRYANALAVAKRWRNGVHGGAMPASGRLGDYLVLIEYAVPDEAAPGRVGDTIRMVRARLERGLPLTETQHNRWQELVEHNRHDCAGMKRIVVKAAAELDACTLPTGQSRSCPTCGRSDFRANGIGYTWHIRNAHAKGTVAA